MDLPFTALQFYGVFNDYNTSVWPVQWLLFAAAWVAVVAVLRPQPGSDVVICAILGCLWTWMAVVYHWIFFTQISPPAYGFGALFLAGAAVFFWQGIVRRRLVFRWTPGPRAVAGFALILFALVVYPIWSFVAGHPYPQTPTFGLPCPTTIFTIGLLALAVPPMPRSTLVVPVLWSLVGSQAAFFLDVTPDLGLLAAAAVGIALWFNARRRGVRGPVAGVAWMASVAALTLGGAAMLIARQFQADLQQARHNAAQGSVLLQTRCGPIEYQEAGAGPALLAVHGSGGGHDQGMAFARPLAQHGLRVIAMSRFGYLQTPLPADASAAAQADAHVCLLDALGITRAAVMGGSAGAPSALQMALRHPDRTSALILLVPLTYKPPTQADSAPPMPAWLERTMMRFIASDFLFWTALHMARDTAIRNVFATPPELLHSASPQEQARVNAMLDHVLPVSSRAAGLRSDTAAGKHLAPAALATIQMPTLVISVRDDRYGTYASAAYTAGQIPGARFVGFEHGGHTWVGHDDEVMAEIVKLLTPAARP